MIEFRIKPHSIRPVHVVEVWRDGTFIGTIAPGLDLADGTLRLVSKYPITSALLEKDDTRLNVLKVSIGPSA
jgi:hypothetical protein